MGVSRKLRGEQLDIRFPIRGRPTRIRVLERAGQMRLNLQPATAKVISHPVSHKSDTETFDQALELTFPERQLTEEEMHHWFCRMFPG